MARIAVVVFNLGGPDRPEAVEPFLINLFTDPAILRVPWPIRPLLGRLIARRRTRIAQMNYDRIGGGSPILPNTEAQARALETALADAGDVRAFVAMRYWHPRAKEVAVAVRDYAPDRIVLLPLYPQFSTTTTESSLADWTAAARAAKLAVPTTTVCCWPAESGFVAALADAVRHGMNAAEAKGSPRVLFSAHGLPEEIVRRGDPYQWQVERTAEAIAAAVGLARDRWVVCYQSRVGPLKWIGPSTEEEIERAGDDKVPAVVVPIAFVSEHSETLVELDIEYRTLAEEAGVPAYVRVPAVGVDATFVGGLATIVRSALASGTSWMPPDGHRLCPASVGACPIRPVEAA